VGLAESQVTVVFVVCQDTLDTPDHQVIVDTAAFQVTAATPDQEYRDILDTLDFLVYPVIVASVVAGSPATVDSPV
jgi:hypothetical protein